MYSRIPRWVNFIHENGEVKISGKAWFSGQTYTDMESQEFALIICKIPGYCEPPFSDDTQDQTVRIWVPMHDIQSAN